MLGDILRGSLVEAGHVALMAGNHGREFNFYAIISTTNSQALNE